MTEPIGSAKGIESALVAREFFGVQLHYADVLSAKAGMPLVEAITFHTNFHRLFAYGNLSKQAPDPDFVALADSYMEQGRTADAERVSAEQRRTMRDAPDAVLVSKLMEFQRFRRDPSAESQQRASEALDAVLGVLDKPAGEHLTYAIRTALGSEALSRLWKDKENEKITAFMDAFAATYKRGPFEKKKTVEEMNQVLMHFLNGQT